MTHYRIELPVDAYEAAQDLRARIVSHDVSPEDAHQEMLHIIAPYCTAVPEEHDTCDLVLKLRVRVVPKSPARDPLLHKF